MPIQAVLYQIIKPLDGTWGEFDKLLRELSCKTTQMCNAAIQEYWQWENFNNKYKQENGTSPNPKELYGCSFENHVYRKLRLMFPEVASNNTTAINQFAKKRWMIDLTEIRRLNKSVPSFKLGTPIQVNSHNYTLRDFYKGYIIDVTLLSKDCNKGRFTLLLNAGDSSKKAIFNSILDKTYKQGAMQIVYNKRKKKWFCIITYTFTQKPIQGLQPDKVMGIDLGVVNAVYWAFNDSCKRGYIPGGEIKSFRERVEARRREMLRIAGSTGHGRKRKLQPTDRLTEKIARFRDAINHKYSAKIVKIAIANKCGVIQMEYLKRISENKLFLKNWPYFDFQNKVIYKALKEGITVRLVKPNYTSQTCSECGYQDSQNRENQATFKCKACGFEANADYNAAKNISQWTEIVKEFRPN